jgi:hypothetical protein
MSLDAGTVTAIVIGSGNVVAWAKLFYDARKNGKNGGDGKTCSYHSKMESRIATVETHKAELSQELKTLHSENRDDHKMIFQKIENLTVAVANAASAAASAASTASTMMRMKNKG